MYYVYVLKSGKGKRFYIGYSADLKTRFHLHNLGKVRSTIPYRPWILVYYEAYSAKADATKRERELKMHAAKNELMKRLKYSIEKW